MSHNVSTNRSSRARFLVKTCLEKGPTSTSGAVSERAVWLTGKLTVACRADGVFDVAVPVALADLHRFVQQSFRSVSKSCRLRSVQRSLRQAIAMIRGDIVETARQPTAS